jgi:DNA-binding transcriptional ArsR family regulator
MEKEKLASDVCSGYDPHADNTQSLKEAILEVSGLSELFKALADETRTKILYLLSKNELCVCDIADLLEMSMPAVSHHLRLLRTMRMVTYRRDGKMVYYSLADDHVLQLITVAQAHYAEDRR